jgi:UDP-N-acetylmuramoylalanine-D-glutamate ligase
MAVTATYSADEQPQRHPLAPGASPSHIRAALLPEDRGMFDTAYIEALDEARETLELTGAVRDARAVATHRDVAG